MSNLEEAKIKKIKYMKVIIRNLFTLVMLDIFIVVAGTLVNLLPSIYDILQVDYGFPTPAPLMISDAFIIIIAASSAIYWGYLIDKIDRKRVLYYALFAITIGLVISALAQNFAVFMIGRIISALGCGAQIPSTYSIIADIVPAKFWSTLYGSLALLISISNGLGQFVSGYFATQNVWNMGWQFTFALLAMISIGCYLLIIMIKLPNRGASDIETINQQLGEEIRKGKIVYGYTIKKEDLKPLWNIKSNRWMLYLCFFAVIPGATLGTFLVYYLKISPFSTIPFEVKTFVSQVFAAMSGLGYFLGTFTLGGVFDWLHSKSPRNRAKYTYIGLLLAIPCFIIGLLCIVPIDYNSMGLDPITLPVTFDVYVKIITAIFIQYPTYGVYFFLMLIGSWLASPLNINRNPTMLEVNLPEHMGSSQAILNFSDQLGRGTTCFLLAFQYTIFSWIFSIMDAKYMFILSLLFYVPAIIWWRKISKQIETDIEKKKMILTDRTKDLQK